MNVGSAMIIYFTFLILVIGVLILFFSISLSKSRNTSIFWFYWRSQCSALLMFLCLSVSDSVLKDSSTGNYLSAWIFQLSLRWNWDRSVITTLLCLVSLSDIYLSGLVFPWSLAFPHNLFYFHSTKIYWISIMCRHWEDSRWLSWSHRIYILVENWTINMISKNSSCQ